jgi:hypothetical protein
MIEAQEDTFQDDLAAQVQDLGVQIDAALAQISLPIERIMRLAVGEVLALPLANLDQISLRGMDGFRVAGARLGQNRGMRALRLTDVASARATDPAQMHAAGANAGHMFAQAHGGASQLGDIHNYDAQGALAAGDLPFVQSA